MKTLLLCLLTALTVSANGGIAQLSKLNKTSPQQTKTIKSYQYYVAIDMNHDEWYNGTFSIWNPYSSLIFWWYWPTDKFKNWADFVKHIHKFYFINRKFYIWGKYDQDNCYADYVFVKKDLANATKSHPSTYRLVQIHYNGGAFGAHEDAWLDMNIWVEKRIMCVQFTGQIWSLWASEGIHYVNRLTALTMNKLDS